MAKQVKGARANKPNDSFGVINNPNLYKNKYREEVDKDDQDEVEQQTELAPEEESEATPKTESFASVQKEGESDAYKKRYDDLKRHYDKKLDEWKSERDALEAANKVTDTGVQMPTTPEEITEFKQKYPDVYKVVESVASMQAEQRTGDLKEKIDSLQQREEDLVVQNAYSELLTAHPDFQDIKTDEKFLEWLDEQPTSIANGIYKNNKDAKWASRVLDLYKIDAGISSKKTTSTNKQSAAEVVKSPKAREISDSNSNKKIWKMEDIARLKSWEFEKFEKEIDQARAEGRITQ
ncbi:hypothetical protein [Idiomarina sp.]|uniref:hypothetical protein n=1 Tax=Idiomarina sp. TaxID=1874361 RepID=UPI000C4E6AD9|nr:hypothetical protein [Idiomarina sp.]MAO66802.1 hypothetical protein [Idiomarina sp.]|tara:strand:- start:1213 stop:2091 length:879 start_codon:yes stop_codon:yes gene_type:complete